MKKNYKVATTVIYHETLKTLNFFRNLNTKLTFDYFDY